MSALVSVGEVYEDVICGHRYIVGRVSFWGRMAGLYSYETGRRSIARTSTLASDRYRRIEVRP